MLFKVGEPTPLPLSLHNRSSNTLNLRLRAPLQTEHDEDPSERAAPAASSWPRPPAVLCLDPAYTIPPLEPNGNSQVQLRIVPLAAGVHALDGILVDDLDTNKTVSLSSLIDPIQIKR